MAGVVTGTRPDLTPAQLLATAQWAVAQGVAYGYIHAQAAQLAVSIGSTVLAVALKFADAYLRGQRVTAAAVVDAAVAQQATAKPTRAASAPRTAPHTK